VSKTDFFEKQKKIFFQKFSKNFHFGKDFPYNGLKTVFLPFFAHPILGAPKNRRKSLLSLFLRDLGSLNEVNRGVRHWYCLILTPRAAFCKTIDEGPKIGIFPHILGFWGVLVRIYPENEKLKIFCQLWRVLQQSVCFLAP